MGYEWEMFLYKTPFKNYTKNQAKTLIYGFCEDFLYIVLLVFSITDISHSCSYCGFIIHIALKLQIHSLRSWIFASRMVLRVKKLAQFTFWVCLFLMWIAPFWMLVIYAYCNWYFAVSLGSFAVCGRRPRASALWTPDELCSARPAGWLRFTRQMSALQIIPH